MRRWPLVLVLIVWATALSASAQSQSVVVLGVRSIEGDDQLAVAFSKALRQSASAVSDWTVSSSTASLSQMMLVHGCDEPDAPCLIKVAEGLQAQTVVYGTMRRSALDEDFSYEFELASFDATSGTITGQTLESLPHQQTDKGALRSLADRGIESLTMTAPAQVVPPTASETSLLSVLSAVEGAQVFVDEQPVGAIKFGRLDLEDTEVGQHQVRVEAENYTPFESVADVQPGVPCEVNAALISTMAPMPAAEGDVETDTSGFRLFGRRPIELLPYALIGVGVLSAGGMIASIVVAGFAENDPAYLSYQKVVAQNDPLGEDVCVRADQQHTFGGMVSANDTIRVSNLCDRADMFRVLEYVFAGVAAASTIGGVTLLILNKRDEKPTKNGDVSFGLRPMFGGRMNGLRATLHF